MWKEDKMVWHKKADGTEYMSLGILELFIIGGKTYEIKLCGSDFTIRRCFVSNGYGDIKELCLEWAKEFIEKLAQSLEIVDIFGE